MLDLSYVGSFQRGTLISTENPQEEVWALIGRLGTPEYAGSLLPDRKDVNWEQHTKYASVRFRQAIELRRSSSGTTLLTKPILLYYSFLNLLRAFMALGPEIIGHRKHGLIFRPNDKFLLNAAELSEGTFTEFLTSSGIVWEVKTKISLEEALHKIPEICYEFKSPERGESDVWPATVAAKMASKTVFLHFDRALIVEETFRTTWEQALPGIKDLYELEGEGLTLRLKAEHQRNDYDQLCEMCEKTMLNRLVFGSAPLWYLLRHKDGEQELPRAGYYFVSLFILGSLARYQPELLHMSLPAGSEMEWFFTRFMQHAERFFSPADV
ncbi:MAG: hypothetical protein A4E19_12215 [Nitrospira sp. SG-bin1]|nr:MAG: hypothetical protein A4E19_12215 [Nitrospira sp. SG-bin1]